MMKQLTKILLLFTFIIYSCTKDEQPPAGKGNQLVITTIVPRFLGSDSIITGGNITKDGGSTITERGVCYSVNESPTIDDNIVAGGAGLGSYNVTVGGLIPNTPYHFRAYAKHYYGTIYGQEEIQISAPTIPTVVTNPPSQVSYTTANTGGEVISDGGLSVTSRGVVCNTTPNPTINNYFKITSDGIGEGPFLSNLTGLTNNTTYHIRAYAINGLGVAYGNDTSFTTDGIVPPTVTCVCPPISIGYTNASISGLIVADGGAPVQSAGICYSSTNQNPVPTNSQTQGPIFTSGSFTVNLLNLNPNTTYYYRSYAKNAVNSGYGLSQVCSFTTLTIPPPTISSSCNASAVSYSSATIQGNVTFDGGAAITETGVCYSTTVTSPQVGNSTSIPSNSFGVGAFNVNLTGLSAGTVYYYRTYAKNAANSNYSYSDQCSFTTLSAPAPIVTTTCPTATTITSNSAVVSGSVSQTGGFTISERGFCYSTTNTTPTIANFTIGSGLGTGTFTSTLSGLSGCTVYYVRAYAKNNANIYGFGPSVCQFTTSPGAPTLTSPPSGTLINTSQYIFYSWSGVACATGYQIQISRSSTFSQSVVVNIPDCSGFSYPSLTNINQALLSGANNTQFCINGGDYVQNGLWYWRVRAITSSGYSNWSSANSYTWFW